jgi:hypothetical protein
VIIGNAAGRKSTLARLIAACRRLPVIEVDKLLWQEAWRLAPPEAYGFQFGCDRSGSVGNGGFGNSKLYTGSNGQSDRDCFDPLTFVGSLRVGG